MINSSIRLLNSISFASAATTLLIAGAAQALTVVPTDLNPGDEYRLVFVTDSRRNATSDDISVYNDFVTNDVAGSQLETDLLAAGLTPDWFAIASTFTVSARENTSTQGTGGVPIYLITGERIANDYDDLWDGLILTNLDTTPSEQTRFGSQDVFTGTNLSGSFQDPLGSFPLIGGGSTRFTNFWIFPGSIGAALSRSLYGMSSVLTVAQEEVQSTPEPSSLLGFITLGGLMLGTAVRRAKK